MALLDKPLASGSAGCMGHGAGFFRYSSGFDSLPKTMDGDPGPGEHQAAKPASHEPAAGRQALWSEEGGPLASGVGISRPSSLGKLTIAALVSCRGAGAGRRAGGRRLAGEAAGTSWHQLRRPPVCCQHPPALRFHCILRLPCRSCQS